MALVTQFVVNLCRTGFHTGENGCEHFCDTGAVGYVTHMAVVR
jgi:hypothetical protein